LAAIRDRWEGIEDYQTTLDKEVEGTIDLGVEEDGLDGVFPFIRAIRTFLIVCCNDILHLC